MTKGDGTVPLLSAERKGFSDDLNAPGATKNKMFSSPGVRSDDGSEHNGLTKNPDVHKQILEFLDRRPASTTLTASVQSVPVSQGNQESLPEVKPALYLEVTGVESVTATDAFGNSTNDPGDTPMLNNVPGVTTYSRGEKAFLVIVDPDQEYTVTFASGSDPIALEITKGTDVTTTMAIRYQDLSLPEGVEAMLKINPGAAGGIERLKVDGNGDGTFETEVAPTVGVEGPDAGDMVPPTIEMSARAQGTTTLITLIAQDSGSGVKDIFFSLDGTNYQRYMRPFSLNRTRTRFIHAFADDNVGNRASAFTFQIPSSPANPCATASPTTGCTVNGAPDQLCRGTSGRDRIIGTTGNDVILGLEGDDYLNGTRGDDLLCGGEGDSTWHGI